MKTQILEISFQTINWFDDKLVDWANGGSAYSLDGGEGEISNKTFAGDFDGSINSPDGKFVFIYQKLGTKGLLLKDGKILREINRSYYQAHVYEYPAAFFIYNGRTYLAHCPIRYCQLDFEDVETGEVVTNTAERKPSDIFHSRLEISKSGKSLMSKGWVWHPVDVIEVFRIEDCFLNPSLLDRADSPDTGGEISTASFIDDEKILVGSSDQIFDEDNMLNLPPKSLAIWNVNKDTFSSQTKPAFEFGNLYAIDSVFAWDIYKFPKIINLSNGQIVEQADDVYSGGQRSSILFNVKDRPQIAFDEQRLRLAIKQVDKVIVITANV